MKNHVLTALMTCLIVACLTVSADEPKEWQAVGDDDMNGRATGYIMALSQDSALIVSASSDSIGFNPTAGLVIIGPGELPTPADPGIMESFIISTSGWASGTWYASIKAFDEVPNYAALGNITRFEVDDTISPAAILTLQ